jgi:hypothetical protein
MMDAIKLLVEINKDRRLIIDLPEDMPTGLAQVTITPQNASMNVNNPARENARAKLLAAGFLVTTIRAPEGTLSLTPEERFVLGTLPPGTPSIDDLVNEDRRED